MPTSEPADPDELRAYLERIAPEAERQGASLGEPKFDDDDWEAKLALVCEERPAVVSFTFGCPAAEARAVLDRVSAALRDPGTNAGSRSQSS